MLDFLRGKFVRKDRTALSAVATADNIIVASASGQVPLVVQGITGGGGNALEVYANGSNRLTIDNNGTQVIGGALQLRYTAITPSASPGTGGAIIPASSRLILAVASAASASRHVMLPLASSYATGFIIIVVDAAGTGATETITVNRQSSDTINGATTKTISAAYGGLMFITTSSTTWMAVSMPAV